MTVRDILIRLEREGIEVIPKLRLRYKEGAQPSSETMELLKMHRDDILRFLLTQQYGLLINVCRLTEQKQEGSMWCKRCFRYQLNPCSPSGKYYGKGVN